MAKQKSIEGKSLPGSLVLHTSWRGRLLTGLAPAVLLSLSAFGFRAGVGIVPVVLGGIGVMMASVALLDYPRSVIFGADGVERSCMLRTERLAWDEIHAIARVRKSRGRTLDRLGGAYGLGGRLAKSGAEEGPVAKRPVASGLVAEVGRRPYLLTDRIESQPEFEALKKGLETWAPGVALRASKPADEVAATFAYKRRRGDVCDPFVDRL